MCKDEIEYDDYELDKLEPTPIDELLDAEWRFYCYRVWSNECGGKKPAAE